MPVPSDNEPTRARPARDEPRLHAIRQATIELLAEVGFDRMTMDAVAGRARASKATIYRYWPDKTALVLDAMRRRGGLVVASAPDSGSLRGDLEVYVGETAANMAGIDGSLLVGLLAAAARDPDLASALSEQLHRHGAPTVAELLDRACKRQEIGPAIDAILIGELVLGALIMHVLVLGLPGDAAFIGRLIDDIVIPVLGAGERDWG